MIDTTYIDNLQKTFDTYKEKMFAGIVKLLTKVELTGMRATFELTRGQIDVAVLDYMSRMEENTTEFLTEKE